MDLVSEAHVMPDQERILEVQGYFSSCQMGQKKEQKSAVGLVE
jgi:hypothetical protein